MDERPARVPDVRRLEPDVRVLRPEEVFQQRCPAGPARAGKLHSCMANSTVSKSTMCSFVSVRARITMIGFNLLM